MSTSRPSAPVDWNVIRQRLAQAAETLNAPDGMSRDRARVVLEERARLLARPAAAAAPDDLLSLVTFRLAGEMYGVDTASVREAFQLRDLALLPGAEPPATALTAWRGDLLMLLDLRPVLGLSERALNDLRQVIVIDTSAGVAGVLADEVIGTAHVRAGEIDGQTVGRASGPYVRGVSPDAIIVLDLRAFGTGEAREDR